MTTAIFVMRDRAGNPVPTQFTVNGDGSYSMNVVNTGGSGGGGTGVAETVWVDNTGGSPLFYVRVDSAGTISWYTLAGASASPTLANLTPVGYSAAGAGGATAANQATEIASLSTIATETTGASNALGTTADSVATSDTGTFSLIALFKRSLGYLSSIVTNTSAGATAANQATQITNEGADGTGITQPTGGSGIRGWLSGIYKTLNTGVSVVQGAQTQTGTISALNQTVTLSCAGAGSVGLSVQGTFNLQLEALGSNDGTNWVPVGMIAQQAAPGWNPSPYTNTPGLYIMPTSGLAQIQIKCTYYGSGSASISMAAASGNPFIYPNFGSTSGNIQIGRVSILDGFGAALGSTYAGTTNNLNAIAINPTTGSPIGVTAGGLNVAIVSGGGGGGGSAPSAVDGVNYNSTTVPTVSVVAGHGAADDTVHALTTDNTGSLIVSDLPSQAAQTNDQPLFVAIAGDPTGDFAGVNLLEALVDPATGLAASVQVVNPVKTDATGAAVPSDAVLFNIPWLNAGQSVIIDTTGYQSLDLTTATLSGTLTISNDGAVWAPTYGFSPTTLSISSSINGVSNYIIGAQARFIRISATTAGTGMAYLRNSPVPLASNNIAMVGGTAVVTGGVAGTLAVGGNVANAVAPTANPLLIGGVDTTALTRRLETDTSGALAVTSLLYPGAQYGAYNVVYSKATVVLSTLTAAQSTISPVIAGGVDQSNAVRVNLMENTGAQVFSPAQTTPGRQSLDELLYQLVAIQRVNSYYLYELLQQAQGSRNFDEPDVLVADFMAQGNNFGNFAN